MPSSSPKVSDVQGVLHRIAPPALAEEWDNVGLQFGDPGAPAGLILLALEVTSAVLDETERLRAGLLITHHPLLFRPPKSLAEIAPGPRLITRLIRLNLALLAAHTNLDSVPEGTNGELADRVGLEKESRRPLLPSEPGAVTGLGVVGKLPAPRTAEQIALGLKENLGLSSVGLAGPADKQVARVAICSGAGGDLIRRWRPGTADLFLTGEMSHHDCAEAVELGLPVVLVGHWESEAIVSPRLARMLRQGLVEAGFRDVDIRVSEAERSPLRRL